MHILDIQFAFDCEFEDDYNFAAVHICLYDHTDQFQQIGDTHHWALTEKQIEAKEGLNMMACEGGINQVMETAKATNMDVKKVAKKGRRVSPVMAARRAPSKRSRLA